MALKAVPENGDKSTHSRSVNPNELESKSGGSNALSHSNGVRNLDFEGEGSHAGGDQE